MKKIFLVSLCLTFLSTAVLHAQTIKGSEGAWSCYKGKTEAYKNSDALRLSPNAPKHSFDVINYTLNFDIFACYSTPFPKSFSASNHVTFRVDSTLNQIKLNAVNTSLIIDSVKMAGVSFTHTENMLTITLDRTYNPGETADVMIYYRHKNVIDHAFYVDNGFVFTDSEPEGARKWFPCWDEPSDKATLDITARVPVNVKLGSNGRLQDSTLVGSDRYYHWISANPVATYLTVLTSRINYKLDIYYWHKLSNPADSVPMRFYFNTGEDPSGMEAIIGPMTDFYSTQFGEHPFEKNGFATLSSQFAWGGMENQTLTSLCPNCWESSLIAHEYAHQWFGDMITCATWADIFLNEGFATFVEATWTENQYGHQAYMNEIADNANTYIWNNPHWAISEPDWAITTPSTDVLFNYAITYMKGSCVLHQLRYVLGDSLFYAGMHAYATDTAEFKYKSATIGDYRDKMAEVAGQDLDWFFDEWVFQPDHPVYQNVYNIEQLDNDNWKVNFTARQTTQLGLVYFQMPLELKILFQDGTDTLIRVDNSFNGQYFSFYFSKQPTELVFDPNNEIVLKEGTTIVGIDELHAVGLESKMLSASPNPFSGSTLLTYHQNGTGQVSLNVYDSYGKLVRELVNRTQTAGNYQIRFNTAGLSPGTYQCRMVTGEKAESIKLILQ
jgi:aminopeptidase N